MIWAGPSVGSWVTYGLGTENQNLPAFVTLQPSSSKGGPRNYSNAFLPAIYQGTNVEASLLIKAVNYNDTDLKIKLRKDTIL